MAKHKGTILIVEDNDNILHLNRMVLERCGYNTHCAVNLQEARELLQAHPGIAMAVLDIILPDGDGLAFAETVKAVAGCPVLMLTSKRDYSDIVEGLTGAADDYMTKPYRIKELIARIQALIQKRQDSTDRGDLVLDVVSGRAFLNGEDMFLKSREFAVLICLMQHEGQYIPANRLYEAAWKMPLEGDTSAVKTVVSRLREKLQGSGYVIESERGVGYCFQNLVFMPGKH